MDKLLLIHSYFKSKLKRQYYKDKDSLVITNHIRELQVSRLKNKSYDYVISGVDLNMIALAKNLLEDGKSCLLICNNDFVDFHPNYINSFYITFPYLYLMGKKHFSNEEKNLFSQFMTSSYENLIKMSKNMNEKNIYVKMDLSYLLYYHKLYFLILNNILFYRNNFKDSFLKFSTDKVYYEQKNININTIIMKEITRLTLENRDRFHLLNSCEISNIDQLNSGQYLISVNESINKSSFSLYADNLIVYKNIFKGSKMLTKKRDQINSIDLILLNQTNKLLKLKYISEGYFFGKIYFILVEQLQLNSNSSYNQTNKKEFPFCIDHRNFQRFLKIYVNKHDNNSNYISYDWNYLKRNFLSSNTLNYLEYQYLKMKLRETNGEIERQLFNLTLLRDTDNYDLLNEEKGKLMLSGIFFKIGDFISIWSKSLTLNNVIKMVKLKGNIEQEMKSSEFQNNIDYFHLIYKIDKDVLTNLLKEYGKISEFILKTGEKLHKNKTIGERNKILISQVLFELNFLHLQTPIEFLLKRHNYYQFIRHNSFSDFIKILSVFADELEYPKEKYISEMFKLLGYKYLITKHTLDI